jgi:nucleotide-binding universal stress UspA family protein
MFERILVCVDSEGLAANAAIRGFELAAQADSGVELLHAVPIPPPMWLGLDEDDLSKMHASVLAAARQRTLRTLGPPLSAAGVDRERMEQCLRVSPGHPAKVILARSRETRADLLVLGPHAKHNLFDFGSTARAILCRSATPIWVQAAPPESVRRILVPVDFSEHSRRALDRAGALASRLGASLRLLHCYSPPDLAYGIGPDTVPGPVYVVEQQRQEAVDDLQEWTREFASSSSVEVDSELVEGEVTDKILEAAGAADLVVIGTHGRTRLSRFLLGGVAYGVLRRSAKPVLAVPRPGRQWVLEETEEDEPARAVRT